MRIMLLFECLMFILIGCRVSSENFPDSYQLRQEIAKSIINPFSNVNTIVYDPSVFVCGNSSEDVINRIYNPNLDDLDLIGLLNKNFEGKVLVANNLFYQLIDTVCPNIEKSNWECFMEDKILFEISGWAESNQSVSIYESFILQNKQYLIEKYFEYDNGKWDFEITNQDYREYDD